MEHNLKLYMVLLGANPPGRLIEQHDIFFGIGTSIQDLKADMYAFWPDAGPLHIDSWREVTYVGDYSISIVPKADAVPGNEKLFFINLGGYKPDDLEEFHYKLLAVADTMGVAVKQSKQTAFYKHFGFRGAASHVDEKYGIDVDDMHKVEDILAQQLREQYSIKITHTDKPVADELHIGYVKLGKPDS